MAELAVLTPNRNEVDDLHRAAERHDPAALAFWERLLGRAPGVGARLFFIRLRDRIPAAYIHIAGLMTSPTDPDGYRISA